MTNRNRSRPFCRLPSWQPECQVPHSGTLALSSVWHLALLHSALFRTWHFGTQLRLALGTLALSSVWHLALWHSALFGTWHFGTQLCLALGTLALNDASGTWHSIGRNSVIAKRQSAIRRAPANYLYG